MCESPFSYPSNHGQPRFQCIFPHPSCTFPSHVFFNKEKKNRNGNENTSDFQKDKLYCS